MLLDFNMMPEATIPGMNGGTGTMAPATSARRAPSTASSTRLRRIWSCSPSLLNVDAQAPLPKLPYTTIIHGEGRLNNRTTFSVRGLMPCKGLWQQNNIRVAEVGRVDGDACDRRRVNQTVEHDGLAAEVFGDASSCGVHRFAIPDDVLASIFKRYADDLSHPFGRNDP